MDEIAINGKFNAGRPLAVTAMLVLCVSISFFWIAFPVIIKIKGSLRLITQFAGIMAMLASGLLLTKLDHDLSSNIASAFGLIATVCTVIILFGRKALLLFVFGCLNILLIVVNNIFYYSDGLLVYLPVIQKITFLLFLIWISAICIAVALRRRL